MEDSGLANSLSFGYTYDAVGNIFQYTAPDGEKITYPQLRFCEENTSKYNNKYDQNSCNNRPPHR